MDDQALFHEAAFTAQRLVDIASEHRIALAPPMLCEGAERFTSASIAHIEAAFEELQPKARIADGTVQIVEATSRAAEVHEIARKQRFMTRLLRPSFRSMAYRCLQILKRRCSTIHLWSLRAQY